VEFYGLGLDYPWRYPDLLRDLTPADIRKVAETYLHPERYLLVVVGNEAQMSSLPGAPAASGTEEKRNETHKQ
jgi:predicted Zn-dependent peptidase